MATGVVRLWTLTCLVAGLVQGIEVDLTSADSIKEASSTIAYDMMSFYTGNNTGDNPGNLPPPYYWWEAGAMFMHMVDYYYYTDDPTYNPVTIQALDWQAGQDGLLMPENQTTSEGNDDQVFWAFAAMSAAELKFPPPETGYLSWAAVAQSVFNQQTDRWDAQNCGGGLRWQINPLNSGYEYKNVASNGGYFQLAARLARYTGNETYTQWAEKMWDWLSGTIIINEADPNSYAVNDGVGFNNDCTDLHDAQFSYNYGILIGGLAFMYNHTQDEKWIAPLNGIMNGLFKRFFFPTSKIMTEAGCERYNSCSTDGLTFKSFTLRWLALTAQLVPQTAETIWPYIVASGNGAAGQCSGPNEECGYHWDTTTWDGTTGVGQQMSALAAIQANLITVEGLFAPLTLDTGAISKGDASAGTGSTDESIGGSVWLTRKITTGDKAGAGILTAILLAYTVGGAYWLCSY